MSVIPCLEDNYAYLVHGGGQAVVVDVPEAAPILREIGRLGVRLRAAWITHAHHDHVGGLPELRRVTGCAVWGPETDRLALDQRLGDGDARETPVGPLRVMATPGHTRLDLSLYLPEARAVFTADTLFVSGCGRLFECRPERMWASLLRLRALPDDTRVYCGHEYTRENLRFATHLLPRHPGIQARAAALADPIACGAPTVPSTIGEEARGNPFLLADDPAVQEALGMPGWRPERVFAEMRARKDDF